MAADPAPGVAVPVIAAGPTTDMDVGTAGQERQIRPVFANTEIFGAVFRRIHSEKGEIHAPKFVFGGPQIRIRRP